MRSLRLELAALLLAGCSTHAVAQDIRFLVQRSLLAGFRYHEAPTFYEQLVAGERLALVREPSNPHDANAVRVEWRGHHLGYVPRSQNAALAWALDRGELIDARIVPPRLPARARRRLEFEVYLR